MNFRETDNYIKGDNCQKRVAEILSFRGWYTLPTYGYQNNENKAPMYKSRGRRSLVLPDIDIAKDGKRWWVEVKFKSGTSVQPRYGWATHGILQRHYYDYLDVADITGISVWLFIYQKDTDEILCRNLTGLEKYQDFYEGTAFGEKMVFFPKDKFHVWCRGGIFLSNIF